MSRLVRGGCRPGSRTQGADAAIMTPVMPRRRPAGPAIRVEEDPRP